jgi:hypothetical protein
MSGTVDLQRRRLPENASPHILRRRGRTVEHFMGTTAWIILLGLSTALAGCGTPGSGFVAMCESVGGCAPPQRHWHKEGVTKDQQRADQAACDMEANKALMSASMGTSWQRRDMAHQIAENCIQAKGYATNDP